MHEIFINYRAADEPYACAHLQGELVRRFGPAAVFVDYRSIRPGQRYPDRLRRALARCLVPVSLRYVPSARRRHGWFAGTRLAGTETSAHEVADLVEAPPLRLRHCSTAMTMALVGWPGHDRRLGAKNRAQRG